MFQSHSTLKAAPMGLVPEVHQGSHDISEAAEQQAGAGGGALLEQTCPEPAPQPL